jgi:hypothetical protein
MNLNQTKILKTQDENKKKETQYSLISKKSRRNFSKKSKKKTGSISKSKSKPKPKTKSKSRSKSELKINKEFKTSSIYQESNNSIDKIKDKENENKNQIEDKFKIKSQKQRSRSISMNSSSNFNQNSQKVKITKKNNIFEDLLKDIEIDLKKRKNRLKGYGLEMQKSNSNKGNLTQQKKKLTEEYKNLSKKKNIKDQKLTEKDNKRYKFKIETVKKYKNDKLTNENMNNSINSVDEIEEQDDNKEKDKENFDKYLFMSKYNFFMKEQYALAKKEGRNINFKGISELWKNSGDEIKYIYNLIAHDEQKKYFKKEDLIEMENGIKPKRPPSSRMIFFNELKSLNKVNSFAQAKLEWKKLNAEDKKKYVVFSDKEKRAYRFKKREYDNIMNNNPDEKIYAFSIFLNKLKEKININQEENFSNNSNSSFSNPYSEQGFVKYAYDEYKKISNEVKKKLEEEANIFNKKIEEKNMEKNEIEELKPKWRPTQEHTLYVKESFPNAKIKYPNFSSIEIFEYLADQYKSLSEKDKEKYKILRAQEKNKYNEQMEKYKKKLNEYNERKNLEKPKRLKNNNPKKSEKQKSLKNEIYERERNNNNDETSEKNYYKINSITNKVNKNDEIKEILKNKTINIRSKNKKKLMKDFNINSDIEINSDDTFTEDNEEVEIKRKKKRGASRRLKKI